MKIATYVAKDTMVVTPDGSSVPVQNLRVSKTVVGYNGLSHSVLATRTRWYTGTVLEFVVSGPFDNLQVTFDQLVATLPYHKDSDASKQKAIVWKLAALVRPKDRVLIPWAAARSTQFYDPLIFPPKGTEAIVTPPNNSCEHGVIGMIKAVNAIELVNTQMYSLKLPEFGSFLANGLALQGWQETSPV